MNLWPLLAVEDGTYFEVNVDRETLWVPVASSDLLGALSTRDDVMMSLVPRKSERAQDVGKSLVMWAVLDNGKQHDALMQFRPSPTLVIREGKSVRRLALWWLTVPVPELSLIRGNRRLAHALGTKKKHATPEILIRPPGSILPAKKSIMHLEHASEARYVPRAVAGHLKDAPDADAWRRKEAA